MRGQTQIAVSFRFIAFFDQRIQRDEIAFRLRHLFIVLHLQKFSVQPAIAPLMSQISLALGNFVFMVYRHMVNTAAVNIQMRPQMFYRHRRAFDMPARITAPPFGIPLQNLIFKFGRCKPQHKIRFIALIFISFHPRAMLQIIAFLPRQAAVSRKFGRVKINIPV